MPYFLNRFLLACLLTGSLRAETPQDAGPEAAVQQFFDAMAAHNDSAVRALFTPDALLFYLRADGSPAAMKYTEFADVLASSKNTWLERIWNPKVLVHGTIAVVWADYDFHTNGRLTHCGVDSISLLKTASGWRIVSISDTHETENCASPLPPPGK